MNKRRFFVFTVFLFLLFVFAFGSGCGGGSVSDLGNNDGNNQGNQDNTNNDSPASPVSSLVEYAASHISIGSKFVQAGIFTKEQRRLNVCQNLTEVIQHLFSQDITRLK